MELTDKDWENYSNYINEYYALKEQLKKYRKLKIEKIYKI